VQVEAADKVPLVGILDNGVPRLFTAFREGVHELGYVEGQNIQLVVKSAQGRPDLLSGLAAELVALKPAVVVTTGVAVRVVRRASPTIPIVVAATRDAVTAGFTSSLAKPADNITGQSFLNTELSAKRLALLKDTVPRARRIAMLVYVDSGPDRDVRETRTRALGVALLSEEVRGPADFERVFAVMARERPDALLFIRDGLTLQHGGQIVDFVTRRAMPSMLEGSELVAAGGLMSYEANLADLLRRGAILVDKILKGANPRDLPFERPTTFQLVINLKAAKALGLTISQSLLQRADQVIE
jgi:putative ABC transport system substrate-binding protein